MAADCVADGDYLGEYSRFFAEFVARVNPEDQLPVKVSVYDVNESELVGEIISVTLQYLNRIYCPPSLQSYIARLVIQAIKSTCKKQPEICGLRQQEKTYAPLKLMQAVTNEVNEICRRYLDNSRLALLPPPSSTPQVTVGAIRNARRKMEDRHMILHDLNTMFNIQDDTIVDYYAVFDGHGGQDAAAYCATHLHQYLVESVHYPTDPESALRDAFLTTDAQFIAKSSTQKLNGGTTAVCALLINKKLYIAWVGDSMASLVTFGGNVKQLVNPHRPAREDESERIRNMGGVVVHCMGVLRVNGFLSISRAIDDLKHVHQALLQSAKRAGSLDNITVIVVFLRSPFEIASRNQLLTHQASNGLLLNNMDPNNQIPLNQFDEKPSYIKQLIDERAERDYEMHLFLENPVCGMARNGKHQDVDDDEYDYTDVGPETDVDAGEDVHDNNYQPLAASSSPDPSPDPSPESEKSPMEAEKHNDDDRNDNNDYSNRENANVCPVDSVVDDGDVVDNRVRPSDKDVRDADNETPRDNGDDDNDDARVETAGTQPHTVVDDDESPPSPRAAKPPQDAEIVADNVADSEDSEDEWDYYRIDPKKEESSATIVLDESCKSVEEQSAENPEFVAKDSSEVQISEVEKDIKCEEQLMKDNSSSELINIDISDETKSTESQQSQNLQKEQKQEDMDFQLNPEAAEFVPLSPPLRNTHFEDHPISGSPLKQTQAMDDIHVPSQSEFEKEVSYRPKDVGEDFLHEEQLPTGADIQNTSSQSMDISEISSTKAEMGDDESMMAQMSISQTAWQPDISHWNDESEMDHFVSDDAEMKHDPMAMSFAPINFETEFQKSIDLNAVHPLDDSSDGAEHGSTPPRSLELCVNEDLARTPPLSDEDRSATNVLCASTPQLPQYSDSNFEDKPESSINESEKINLSSDISDDTSQDTNREEHIYTDFDPSANKVFNDMPDRFTVAYTSSSSENNTNLSVSSEKLSETILAEEDMNKQKEEENVNKQKEEEDVNKQKEEEDLCKNEDAIDTQSPSAKMTFEECKQLTNLERLQHREESPDFSDSSDALVPHHPVFDYESPDYPPRIPCPKPLLPEHVGMQTPDIKEMYVINDDVPSKSIPEKDLFNEPSIKINQEEQSNQSTDWTDFYKPDKVMLHFESPQTQECNFLYEDGLKMMKKIEAKSKDEKLRDKDEDNNNEDDNNDQLGNIIESNPPGFIEKFTFMSEQLQHENQTTEENKPMETLMIDTQTEQEQTENKAAEVALTDVSKITEQKTELVSEDIPPKQEESVEILSDITVITDQPKEVTGIAEETIGAAVAATMAVAAVADATSSAKAKTTTTTAKCQTKNTTTKRTKLTTKPPTKSTTPTSPSKTITRTTASLPAQSIAKKPITNTASRPKQLDGSAKTTLSSTTAKTIATKVTTIPAKPATTTATKTSTSPRLSSGTTRPKTTTTTSSKVSTRTVEKKTTISGDTKPANKSTTAKPASTSLRTTTTNTTTKTTLVKTSTTAKTSTSNVTSKPRPSSATSTVKTTSTSKEAAGVNGVSRPKTAPSSGNTPKSRESAGKTVTATTVKSPLIDKQSKETVNKQISRSGISTTPRVGNRASMPASTTGVTKSRTSIGKSTGNASAISPTKKSSPTSKAASKTPETKRMVLPLNNTHKTLQNGILQAVVASKENAITAAVISTSDKPEDDVPRKDASPVNVPTDNQLIAD
ncbi:hypothetical protein P5V15_005001 [Pogonomyrmex californicus]